MTASYTSRWLLHSIHYKLALRGDGADNPDQRISEDIGGFISGEGGRGAIRNYGIYNYTIQALSTATNLVAFSIILWRISAPWTSPSSASAFPASCSGSPSSTPASPPA